MVSATQVQLRRGTAAQTAAFTGAPGEVSVNTDTYRLHVHDGQTAGGFPAGNVTWGTYGGNGTQPTFTPPAGMAWITFDSSDGRQWNYFNGAWH